MREHRSDRDRGYSYDTGASLRERDTAKERTPEEEATQRVFRLRLEVDAAAMRAGKLAAIIRREAWQTEHASLKATHAALEVDLKAHEADAKASAHAQEHYIEATKQLGNIATALEHAKEPRVVPPVAGEEAIEPRIVNRSAVPDDVLAWVAGLGASERSALIERVLGVGGGSGDRKDGFAVELANYLGNKRMRSAFLGVAKDPKRFNRVAYEKAHASATAAANARTERSADDAGAGPAMPIVAPPPETPPRALPPRSHHNAGERPTVAPSSEIPLRALPPMSRHDAGEGPAVPDVAPPTTEAAPRRLPLASRDEVAGGSSVQQHKEPTVGTVTADVVPSAAPTLDRTAKQPSVPTKTSEMPSSGLGAWAGAGKLGRIFRNTTAETFVDAATKETAEVATNWMMAEFDQFELETNIAMEVDRKIHLKLARGGVVIKSRARAFLHADQLPNDVHAALHAPARLLTHDGAIFVTDDKGMHLLRSFDHPKLEEPSAAALLAHEPMLGYETAPEQRIREAEQFVAVTVPTYDNNLLRIESIMRDAPHAAMGLKSYIRVKLAYENPPPEALAVGQHMIARIEELLQFSWTGYEGTDVMLQLGQMQEGFTQLLHEAETAKPAEKHALDHAADLVVAIGKAGAGVVLAVKEVGLMARDLGMWGIDKLAGAVGYEIDWSAASSIGKAYESGKSTSEIFTAIVDGIIDSWANAIEHAENGDYAKLMDLGAELALDIAIEVATAGATTAGTAAKRAGTAAQLAERALVLTEDAATALTRRAETLLQRIKQAIARAPEAARATLLDTLDTASGWLTGLQESVKVVDTGVGAIRIVDKTAITKAIQRSRGMRALETAKHAMTKLRGGAARAQGASVIEQLEKLAKSSRMPDTIYAIARRIAEGEDKAKFVGALDKLLKGTAKALDEDVVTGVLRHAADAVDPLAFLDNIEWIMGRNGLSAEARKALIRRAVGKSALDLRWLRELTDLPDKMLEGMALDPATHWRSYMKVSKKPSDYFPSSLRKLLKGTDYADAAAKLRGVAGELVFVLEGVELPGGLQIVGRQVNAAGKIIDFALHDASGARAMLEVKAWTAETWVKELAAAELSNPKKAFAHMIEQLKAAKSTGQPVYLAVSDAIGKNLALLKILLSRQYRLAGITTVTFPEAKLKEISSALRKGLGMAGAAAMITADQIAKEEADD